MIKDSEVKKLLAESFRNDRSAGVIWESAKGLISQEARQFISMFLETAKNSGHIDRRRAAVYILGNLSVRKSVPILVSLLLNKSEDEGLRGEAAEALGNIMDHRAIDPLIQTLDDDSVEVRFWSIFALGQLDAKKALPRLRKIARIDKATLRGWWSIKKEAIDAINNIMRKPITSRIR